MAQDNYDDEDAQDYQDYLDSQEYDKYVASQKPAAPAPKAPMDPVSRAKAYLGPMDIGGSLENLAGGVFINPAVSRLGRVAQNAALSGARSFGNTEGGIGDKAAAGAKSAALGGALSGVMEGASAAGSKLADYFMQKAVGMKKYQPGVGNRLADQGVWGWKGRMANQVDEKLPQAEEAVQNVIGDIQGQAPGSEFVNAVSERGKKFLNPDTGLPFPGKETSYQQVQGLADELGKTESYSPQALLKLKRASDYEGYTASGTPATSLKAELEQAQGNKARELLDSMSSGASKEALADEQALILAKKGLSKPDTIHANPIAHSIFGKIPGSSLVSSTAAQASQKGASLLDALSDPKILQTLLGK